MKAMVIEMIRISGIVGLWRFLNRKKITILMLHGVSKVQPEAEWQPLWNRITPEKLDIVLGQLGKYYNFVSLTDAVAMLSGSIPVVNNSLVLTFDDGYRNNITEAWPVLRKHNAPGAMFVATGFVETQRSFWIDRLDYSLQMAPDEARLIKTQQHEFDLRGSTRTQLSERYKKLRLTVKNDAVDDEEMLSIFDRISAELEKAAGTSISDVLDKDNFVSVARWSELENASRHGMTIGSHSVGHRQLAKISRQELGRQLEQSKQEIESHLKQECRYFCYPNGSFDDAVLQQTRDAGYLAALTTVPGLNKVGDDLFTLKRYAFPVKSTAFGNVSSISGLFELPMIRRLFGMRS